MDIGIYQAYWGRIGGGQRYVGVVADVLAFQHQVEVVHHCPDFDPAEVAEPMELDLSRVRFRYVPHRERPAWSSTNPMRRLQCERQWGREISKGYDLFIDSSDNVPYFCHARRGVLLTHFPLVTFEEFHGHTTEAWQSRAWPKRVAADVFHRIEWGRRFASYDLYLTNSEFTRHWMKRRWGLQSVVVHPPLRSGLKPLPKESIILTVGAFHHAEHKKQDVLLGAFRDLCDRGLSGWRYVLVGACSAAAEDQAYLLRLREMAGGYPVEFRTNVSGDELKDLLGRATVLWHSMGYGVDPEREPGRLEHFGMAATEAMAAGCVPVVFRGGGLPESVNHGETGFLWRTLDELTTYTLNITRDAGLQGRLAAAAQVRATDFSRSRFAERLHAALAPVLDRVEAA
jgi:glycosyltransferase involved in cell wall biosynthesis